MIVQFSAIIDSIVAKKDGTLSLRLGTQEMAADDTAKIFEHRGHQLWIGVAEAEMSSEDLNIPEVVTDLDNKSPSQRLRDRMAVYYKESKGSFEGFDSWYRDQLASIGQRYLDKLN
jgi:hypothetical protein